jgi:tetratricopeptide (TPR) repeat protein
LATRGYLLIGSLRAKEAEQDYREALLRTTNPEVRADLIYRLATLLQQSSRSAEVPELVKAALPALAPSAVLLRARLTIASARAHFIAVNLDEAVRGCELALTLADQLIDPALAAEVRARALGSLADVARIRRDSRRAIDYAQQTLAAARQAGLPRLENTARGFLGGLLYDQGDLSGSSRMRREALEGALATGDSYTAAYFMVHLAENHLIRCEPQTALDYVDQAINIFQQIGDARGLTNAQSARGSCLLMLNQIDAAQRGLEQLLAEFEERDTRLMWGYYLGKLAMIQMVKGDPAAAEAGLQQALSLSALRENRMLRFELHNLLAVQRLLAGQPAAAAQALQTELSDDGFSLWARLDRQCMESLVALEQGDRASAQLIITVLRDRAEAGDYPLYRLRATRLAHLLQAVQPASTFPQLLWVGVNDSPVETLNLAA